jgi:hypothetical protein
MAVEPLMRFNWVPRARHLSDAVWSQHVDFGVGRPWRDYCGINPNTDGSFARLGGKKPFV